MIFFGDNAISPMNNSMLEASQENIIKAVADIKRIEASGGTNMSGAFEVLFETFNPYLPELEITGEFLYFCCDDRCRQAIFPEICSRRNKITIVIHLKRDYITDV